MVETPQTLTTPTFRIDTGIHLHAKLHDVCETNFPHVEAESRTVPWFQHDPLAASHSRPGLLRFPSLAMACPGSNVCQTSIKVGAMPLWRRVAGYNKGDAIAGRFSSWGRLLNIELATN